MWRERPGVTREQPLYTTASQPFPWRYPPDDAQGLQDLTPLTSADFVDMGPLVHHVNTGPTVPLDDDMEVEILLDALAASATPPATVEAPPRTLGRHPHPMQASPARAPSEPSSSGRESSGTHHGAGSTHRHIDLNAYHQGPMRSALARSVELDRRRAQLAEMRRTQSTRRPAHSATAPGTTPTTGSSVSTQFNTRLSYSCS